MEAVRELYLAILFLLISQISGLQTGLHSQDACQPLNLNLTFNFNLEGATFYDRSWYLNSTSNKIAGVDNTGLLTVEPQYNGRVTFLGSDRIMLSAVNMSDSGSYLFIIVTDGSFTVKTATTTVTVHETPNNSCKPIIENNNASSFIWRISDACNVKTSITARWENGAVGVFTCPVATVDQTFKCCAEGDPVTFCRNDRSLCTNIVCNGTGDNESATINNTTSNKSKSISSDTDIKVIVPAVVVPCGLLIIGGIILVFCCVRHRTGKNVHESPDGMAVQDKGNNIDDWKHSQEHGKATNNLDAVNTTPDGFIIYPGPAAMSTARSYKDKKHHDVTDQYSRPYAGPYHHQAEYFPSTYTSARAYTHKDKKHHGVTDQYSRPYTGTYGYQAGYVPSTFMSARTYLHKGRNHDYEGPIHQQASHLMGPSRLAYDQTAYDPQSGHYWQSSQDVYYSGGGQYFYGQRSRSHYDHSGRKQQREYYNQYEMADYGGNRAGYRQTKQDTAF